jgi:DNA-binding transcriptional ArsR family regulator
MNESIRTTETFDIDAIQEQASKASGLLRAMCNETRLLLLCQLVSEERHVNELAALLGAPQSTISQHLALLRREGFVTSRREGQTRYYSLAGDEARAVLETLQSLYCESDQKDA